MRPKEKVVMTRDKFYCEYSKFAYANICYRVGHDNFKPFSLSIAAFAWKFRVQKSFIDAVTDWGKVSIDEQFEALKKFLIRVCRVDPTRLKEQDNDLRNCVINEIHQRMWILMQRRKKFKRKEDITVYLKETGLGRYFKTMQRAGLKVQI